MAKRAITMDKALELLAAHWVLVRVRAYYWLIHDNEPPQLVNCNTASALKRKIDLDAWKVEAWTGDRALALELDEERGWTNE